SISTKVTSATRHGLGTDEGDIPRGYRGGSGLREISRGAAFPSLTVCQLMRKKHQQAIHCRPLAERFIQLISQLANSHFSPLVTLAKTLDSWREESACMWRFTKNNPITERYHIKMKLIQRRAYGFRNFNNYRLRVIAQCG
ncbi:MAG: transposase, partial [Akkermansiaceae bacterium]